MKRPTYAEPTLGLWPDEQDIELPLDEEVDGGILGERLSDAVDRYADEATALRRALVDALAYVESGQPAPGSRVRAWRELAGTAYVDNLTPEERRDDGIARAAAKWTDDEVAQVNAAIVAVCLRKREEQRATIAKTRASGYRVTDDAFPGELTTADVWQELGEGFPVTKGIAGRMASAASAGIIANTGRTIIAPKDATGPNHGQRLTVWRAL